MNPLCIPIITFLFKSICFVTTNPLEILIFAAKKWSFLVDATPFLEPLEVPKPLLRALLRYVLPRDSLVADFCAGAGQGATFLNDTGLVKAFAFDASTNIKLLSKNVVDTWPIFFGDVYIYIIIYIYTIYILYIYIIIWSMNRI